MKILHILRSKPDVTVDQMMEIITNGDAQKTIPLYNGDVDWPGLVDDILSYDKVISWW